MGPLILLFWTFGDVSSQFQSQSGQPYLHLAEMYVSWCLRATCPPAPPFLLNYITQLPWRPHKLLLPNCSPCLGPCKWQPPWPPFALALVTDWYQYPGCPPRMHMAPLYKRAGLPDPLLTFWLNMIPVTSRSKARNLT